MAELKGSFHIPLARYDYDELINRDKASLDIFWLKRRSLEESDKLSNPDVLAQEIVVHRLASLRTTQSQGSRPGRELRRRVEALEAAWNSSGNAYELDSGQQ